MVHVNFVKFCHFENAEIKIFQKKKCGYIFRWILNLKAIFNLKATIIYHIKKKRFLSEIKFSQ